jgi:8-oxo-dGTP pyrophosphatase MutT (NUDIX family)
MIHVMPERWKPSVTVAAIIERISGGERRFLLVEEHTPEGLKLNNPAGHLDPEESPLQGVVREVLEETACVFTPDRLVGVYLSRFQRPGKVEPPSSRRRRSTAPRGGAADLEAARRSAGEDVTFLRFAFGGTAGEPDPQRSLDDGIVRTLWMTLPELRACRARHRSPLVLTCIEDFVSGRRYPLDAITTDPTVYEPEIKR